MGSGMSSTKDAGRIGESHPGADKAKSADGEKKKLKPCCACPETKTMRDECIVLNGEENCAAFIEAHRRCMREHGFEI